MASRKEQSFFEKYAHEYDLLTDAKNRLPNHRREVAALIGRFHPQRVLDAGCGTGLTSALFAEAGIETVGVDRSRRMLAEARAKYGGRGLPLQFKFGEFERLPKRMYGRFDLVVCLANSIVGVGSKARLQRALRQFHRVLTPGGSFVIQMLNYEAVADGVIHPVRVTGGNGRVYERFFERHGRTVSLYVTRVDINESPSQLEIFRHTSDSFTVSEVLSYVRKAGFVSPRTFGDLRMEKRFSRRQRDLIFVAKRR